MSRPDSELNRLFHDMANQSSAPEPADVQSRRRQRAIGGMRALHRRMVDDRSRVRQRRRYWSWGPVAAAVALCGSAVAGAGGFVHFSSKQPAPQERTAALSRMPKAARTESAARAPNAVTAVTPVPQSPEPVVLSNSVTSATQPKAHTAELEEVNRLFAEAKRARRERRDADALALLQRLLAEHSSSVLAHEASVERFRALARLGRSSEAQRYASAYLARYPGGFAADEARRVVSGETQ
jgi:hypothetical protein